MELTIREAREAAVALRRIGSEKVTAVVAYRLAKLTRLLKDAVESSEEAQGALLKSCGDPIEGQPGQYKIRDMDAWEAQIKELLAEVVEIDTTIRIKLAELGEKVEPEVLVGLFPFLDE